MIVALAVLLASGRTESSAEEPDDFDDVYRGRPGLVAIWRDSGRQVSSLQGRLALRLEADQAPHPSIRADRFEGRWQGTLKVVRPGTHRFFVEVAGTFTLNVAGREVLNVSSGSDGGAASAESEPIELRYGPNTLTADYRKLPGQRAALRVFWEGEDGIREPVPASALVHDEEHESPLARLWQQVERGRELVAQHGCVRCHRANASTADAFAISADEAPRLDGIGSRRYQAWIDHWLKRPRDFRPHSSMPRLFGETRADAIDRYAVAYFLSRQGGPLIRADEENPSSAGDDNAKQPGGASEGSATSNRPEDGENRFAKMGCIACHLALSENADDSPLLRPVAGMSSKTDRNGIEAWLTRPHEFHPGTRMPDFEFATKHREALAVLVDYLAASRNESFETLAPAPTLQEVAVRLRSLLPETAERLRSEEAEVNEPMYRLGQLAVQTRGCLECHRLGSFKSRMTSAPGFETLVQTARQAEAAADGCLAESQSAPGAQVEKNVVDSEGTNNEQPGDQAGAAGSLKPGPPDFAFDDRQRRAIGLFLAHGTIGAKSAAPVFHGEMRLRRSGCVACHQRNGFGGAFSDRITRFVRLEHGAQVSDFSAPDLSGIGEKLKPEWIRRVIEKGERARSWMNLKMPLFPQSRVNGLATQLILADGEDPRAPDARVAAPTAENLEAARLLVGKTGMNCVGCHDVLGHASVGVRGPDLAGIFERVRHEWFQRWLLNPQRISPGTRMPSFFYGGRSAVPQYFGGRIDLQVEALWRYFSLGNKIPMPILDVRPDQVVADGETDKPVPKDRPIAVHGFMLGHAGLRGIALGYPSGTHFSFDAETCRLTRVWRGEFLSLSGWYGAGRDDADKDGNKILGEIMWHGPDRGLIALSDFDDPQSLPRRPEKPYRIRFDANWTRRGDAGFAHRVEAAPNAWISVEDRPKPVPHADMPAFERQLTIDATEIEGRVWTCLHDGIGPAAGVKLFDDDGERYSLSADATGLIRAAAQSVRWIRVPAERGDWWFGLIEPPRGMTWAVATVEYRAKSDRDEIQHGQLWLSLPAETNRQPISLTIVCVYEGRDSELGVADLNALLNGPANSQGQ